MNTGTTDQLQAEFHEVKGKVKEKARPIVGNPDIEAEGQAETSPARSKRKSDRSKQSWKS